MKVEHLPHYTYEDYAKWQGDWELIEGIPYAMASPTRLHQRFVFRLQRLIVQRIEKLRLLSKVAFYNLCESKFSITTIGGFNGVRVSY